MDALLCCNCNTHTHFMEGIDAPTLRPYVCWSCNQGVKITLDRQFCKDIGVEYEHPEMGRMVDSIRKDMLRFAFTHEDKVKFIKQIRMLV